MSDLPDDLSPDTLAVHAGRGDLRALGVHAPPLDLSTTYPFSDLDGAVASLDAMMEGRGPTEGGPIYSRLHSPTVARFEDGLAAMEGTDAAVAFASGMAAITAALLAAREPGKNHVVGVRPIYGTTDKLLSSGTLGLEVTWTDARGVAGAMREDTCLVCVETPVNPTLDLVDLEDVVAQASGVPVMCDSTFATPVLQRPARHGVALVVHSGTKFLGGHGDVLAGVVACSDAWAARLREIRILTGANLHPLAGYLLHRGLPTLPLRVRRAQETATALAAHLAAHESVSKVYHPSVDGRDPLGLVGRQMDGPRPDALVRGARRLRGGGPAHARAPRHHASGQPGLHGHAHPAPRRAHAARGLWRGRRHHAGPAAARGRPGGRRATSGATSCGGSTARPGPAAPEADRAAPEAHG